MAVNLHHRQWKCQQPLRPSKIYQGRSSQTTPLSSSCFICQKKQTVVGIRGDQEAAQRSRRPTVTSKCCSLCPNCLVKMITAAERRSHAALPAVPQAGEPPLSHRQAQDSQRCAECVWQQEMGMFNPDLGFAGTHATLAPMKGLIQKWWSTVRGILCIMLSETTGERGAQDNSLDRRRPECLQVDFVNESFLYSLWNQCALSGGMSH